MSFCEEKTWLNLKLLGACDTSVYTVKPKQLIFYESKFFILPLSSIKNMEYDLGWPSSHDSLDHVEQCVQHDET
jgi:hypothetical protein